MVNSQKKILIIVGPTAVGKSALAVDLAQKFRGEIISCDSRQIYRGFDIGTDKPPVLVKQAVPHYLIDVVDPEETFSAADFSRLALEEIDRILSRGNLPMVVGGTGLYHRALVEGLFPGPGRDDSLRNRLKKEAQNDGLENIYKKLQKIDPAYAEKISRADGIRIIRALEIFYLTGRPISEHFSQTVSPLKNKGFILYQIGLKLERKVLYQRIDERVRRMFSEGLIEETRQLLARGISEQATPFKGLGYRQVLRYLQGEISLEEAVNSTQIETRHYAKRQLTWFKKTEGIIWFEAEDREKIENYVREYFLD
ncbi:MAG TPA: tRNA (adenosine(37)-N6)-dimethylallyltransferase MiaA [Candidatus Saccharicenans sp.]|nr:tRNA (adenosine(37)-N6)-dimethylallyltransferase MiaA [Candidatus Saccharicenans sp.]HRD01882.1 tRNA (adenosine(37)-N6)-dimethylallyltransferase MiaA [Candidatus Saccharicenans sp.]